MRLILWALLLFLMLIQCCPPCKEEYPASSAELSKHRKRCDKYAAYGIEQTSRRKEVADRKADRKKRRRLNSVLPGTTLNILPGPVAGSSHSAATPPPDFDEDITMGDAPSPPPPPPSPPPPAANLDKTPAPIVVLPPPPDPAPVPVARRVILHVRDTMQTALNCFRIFRVYPHRPSYDPDAHVEAEDLANFPVDKSRLASLAAEHDQPDSTPPPPPWPFANMTIYNIMSWLNTGSSQKSEAEATRLVEEVINAPDFSREDLRGFNAHRENLRFDKAASGNAPWTRDGWKEVEVEIEIPSGVKDKPPLSFKVPGLHHRSIVEVIKTAFADISSRNFHLAPFTKLYKSASDTITRIYDELYTSDAWIEAHNLLQKQRPEPGCKLERVIAGLMFWSDSTHLADFGTAKAWPIYMYFANLSKYTRARPNSGACHHMAYIPSLPDRVMDFIGGFTKKSYRKPLITHCRRALMQQVWRLMLDKDFREAYAHGIVIKCFDGIYRRVYPRIFTYSADYPEKVLLTTIRDKGFCLCPRCLVEKGNVDKMGTPSDMRSRLTRIRTYFWDKVQQARDAIYKAAFAVTSDWVENILKEYSLVPTVNAFSELLRPYGAEMFPILVVDLLHEFELGVWKAVFTHIIRVLYAIPERGTEAVIEFNRRFRMVPTFGVDTIRRITTDASERKKLAARDYEDLLQTIIAVIEGLLPEPLNSMVMRMLFRLAEWHALAKLRMHTDDTLTRFDKSTVIIGRELRNFRDYTKANYATKELAGEVAVAPVPPPPLPPTKGKFLNLDTYKFHAIGDYPSTVRFFGTTDSENSPTASWPNSSDVRPACERLAPPPILHAVVTPITFHSQKKKLAPTSTLRDNRLHLMTFLHDNEDDPAKKDFIPKLKNHLLGRLLQREYDGDEEEFSEEQRKTVKIIGQHIYTVQMLRVNYTTYDMRINQDSINPRTHADVMVISPETGPGAHPFWYARVLGVFHADVLHTGPESRTNGSQSMEFLWVRWFGIEPNYRSGFKVARLPKVGFVPEDDPNAFGFLDPALPGLSGNQMIGQIFMLQFGWIATCSCVTLVGGIGHASVASALPKDDLDAEEEEEILAPPDSSASAANTSAPQKEQPSAEVPLASQQPDAPITEIPGEGIRGHPHGEGDDNEGGFDSEEDSDIEPQDLDSDDSDEGEGSDGAYDDDVEQDDNDFASV
ncbi:C2H2-type domain-containing protein [Mycena venus]|uniref:C2H2-type domain-containing protein n=1 Tax=Mycena venus TaxID=2733690 RepID=A0A8H6Z7K3_9AGAR|nr:C2H2-type domain-containing protein [Mycena venus]